ncbi:peptide-N(4)-(N-acetyl-beta-glucosaminyl)asparagine amidase-like isoform X2 [Mercenaria mercenaria]|nr:peptide-N(4)-(N-acetyl-beta-glucosaminyl)asparagine amidase-like isoform X2 [Mercenaria mercenaria]
MPTTPSTSGPQAGASTGAQASGGQVPSTATLASSLTNLSELVGKEQDFYRKLEAQLQHVLVYEDRRQQQKAREVIPIAQLEKEAKTKLEQLSQCENSGDDQTNSSPKLDMQDCLVLALLNWFKNSFFKWVDAPACRGCGGKPVLQGNIAPTPEELRFGGNRVENYKCPSCQTFTKFVRYNDPGKLLETREGRCGEWANCFTLCCRAMNFEARYVLDWTDHVWTEVYSNSQQRWVHCDPCENTCDKPLLYEVGWGKKLTYIIAFSVDDVEDVTWRYTSNFDEILKRRNECRENWLVKTLYNLDKKKWSSMPEAKRNIRLKRKIVELVEFMTPKAADGQNLSGRTTGSLAWRLARGELGTQPAQTAEPYVFKLTEKEKSSRKFHLTYSSAKDEYVRLSNDGEKSSGYQSMVNKSENIFRKVEADWKMAYLARNEGTDKAEIVWKFDFTESSLKVDSLEVKIDCATYENGKINWIICSDETCAMLKGGPALQTVNELNGQTGFTLTASLSGGQGNVAWQHTQLFRQSSEDTVMCPFEILIKFK